MLKDIVSVRPLDSYRIEVCFEDGVQGVVDVSELVPFEGVFEPLQQADQFAGVRVHPELGVVCWPNGADLDSDVLYALVAREPMKVDAV